MRKLLLLTMVLLSAVSTYAQAFSADKVYTIESNKTAGKYMQDNGSGTIDAAALNSNSYWQFETTGTEDCYYIKNAVTGKYMQSTHLNDNDKVEMGMTGVSICVKELGTGVFGIASTDQDDYSFSASTKGANCNDGGFVAVYTAQYPNNAKSFWKIVEATMPEPEPEPEPVVLSSPWVGNSVTSGEFYLYNVESGLWLQNNDSKIDDWSTRAAIGTRGFEWNIVAADGAYALQPKFYVNGKSDLTYSINPGNNYIDTDAGQAWTITPVEKVGLTNTYTISCGNKVLGTVKYNEGGKQNNLFTQEGDVRWYLENPDYNINMTERNTWQFVTKEERLAKMQAEATEDNPVDASWLIPAADFANNDKRFELWTRNLNGGNGRSGDGGVHGSRCIESWNSNSIDLSYTITDIPNGTYRFTVQGYYRDGNKSDVVNRRNNGSETIRSYYFANEVKKPLMSILDGAKTTEGTSGYAYTEGGFYYPDSQDDANRCFNLHKGYVNEEIEVVVTTGSLKIGIQKTEGVANDWTVIDNFHLTYLGYNIDLSDFINALNAAIESAEAYTGVTTDILASNLAAALETAKATRNSKDSDEISQATMALNTALAAAQADDVSALRPTVALAKAEGIDVSAQEEYLVNGKSGSAEEHLRLVRNLRKLNAIEKVDITRIACSEPANQEADYFLYNVGAGIFFSTTADWGTHIALDNPGMLIHFRPDGEWVGAPGRPVFHLSGNGWDGMNWGEEYWDKNGENKLAFVPVEGKDKVYNLCEWDNYNWHFVYDPAEDVCDGNTHYWNSVQKRNWNVDDYKDNPFAQWMLVSPEAYKAAMAKATDEKPLDVTYLINNPNFTKARVNDNDNWDRGWTGVGDMMGRGRDPWCVIEWFQKDANMTQTITGLPAGKYAVSCYGFYRDGSSDHEAEKVRNGEALIQNAFLFANNEEVALPNVTSEAGNMPGVGETREGVDEFACWPAQANEYFQTGLYKVTTPVVEVGNDGNLTIGVKSAYNGELGSWVVVGNFRLTCLGLIDYVTVGEDLYATYVAPFDVDFAGAEVEAFAAQANKNGKGYVYLAPVTTVPAGAAVVVKAAAAGTYPVLKTADATLGTENDLVAATEEVTANGTQYILANQEGKVGFAKATPDTKIAAGKGYLVITGEAVKAFYPFGEDATAIANVNVNDNDNQAVIYNVAGQRVSKMQKGINIVNGKKILK